MSQITGAQIFLKFEQQLPKLALILTKYTISGRGGDKLWSRVMASEPLGDIRFVMMAPRKGQHAREVLQQVWA